MTKSFVPGDTWQAVDTANGDVLLTGGPFYINFDTTQPAPGADCHILNVPIVIPKDVVAHIKGHHSVTGSVFGTGDPF